MSQQNEYAIYHGAAIVGQLYGNSPKDVVTGAVEDAAGIQPGVFVTYGTEDNQIKLLVDTNSVIVGATILTAEYEISVADLATGEFVIKQKDMASILRKGYIYMECEEAVAKGEAVYTRFAAGTGSVIGAVRNDADTASAKAVTGATFDETTTAAGPALVRIDL